MRNVLREIRIYHVVAYALSLALVVYPGKARAGFVYAYAKDDFNLLSLSAGVSNIASFSGNTAAFSGVGASISGSTGDALQAKAGPGPFPAENTFTPQGKMGQYARADSEPGPYILQIPGRNVAEAYRTSLGSASTSASVRIRFTLEQLTDDPIDLRLTALPKLIVQSNDPSSHAFASVSFKLTLSDPKDPTKELLIWEPVGFATKSYRNSAGIVSDVSDPYALNAAFNAFGPTDQTYAPTVGEFGRHVLKYQLQKGQTYNARIDFSESVTVELSPEPSAVTLALSAGAWLGIVRWYGRKSAVWNYCRSTSRRIARAWI
jgi:hypothetical protein